MAIGIKDGLKLIGISIVAFCAVYVCTFMLNFYLDVLPLRDTVEEAYLPLYEAQLSMAQFTAAITGGILALIAVVMLIFYIRLYIDSHAAQLGILKALGYSRKGIALKFWVFGLSVFLGCALGFGCGWASMSFIYDGLAIEGLDIAINFHYELLLGLVMAPTAVFTVLSCVFPYFTLRRPVMQLMRGTQKQEKLRIESKDKNRSFLAETCFAAVSSKKTLAFFVALSTFCFSAMVQMGLSMKDLSTETMGLMILIIGLVLAVVTMFMALTSLIRANAKNISIMKAFGYSLKDCCIAVLGGFVPFAVLGFALGTVYQYGLLMLMVNLLFANVSEMPSYSFDVPVFFITLAAFLVSYTLATAFYIFRINKISVKEVMTEI